MANTNQLMVLIVTLIIFLILMKRRLSVKALVVSVIGGGLTFVGELKMGIFSLYAFIDGLITFLMWYSIIIGIVLLIAFFSRDRSV